MEYWVKCRNCKWCDPTETNGYKWYCEARGIYVDPDEVSQCRYYVER